jgi:hypothetical protein
MKLIYILVIFVSSNLFGQDYENSIVRNDNDFATYQDIESLKEPNPKIVLEKIKSIIKFSKKQSKKVNFFSYKINLSEKVEIYALIVNGPFTSECNIFAYDIFNKKVTLYPIKYSLKWAKNSESGFNYKLLDLPMLNVQRQNENYNISVKERVHNGNTYNAVINKTYKLNSDLSFDLKFCFEENALTFDGHKIIRILYDNLLYVYKKDLVSIEYLGKILLNSEKSEFVKKDCFKEDFCDVLFTCSGKKEEIILKKGYISEY